MQSQTRVSDYRICDWHILAHHRFTSSHCRIPFLGRGQTHNDNSGRDFDWRWRILGSGRFEQYVFVGQILCRNRQAHSCSQGPHGSSHRGTGRDKGKPVRFRINDLPGSSSAWVGIYPSSTPDDEHGEEGVRWNWLNKIDVSNATFPEKSEGRWSIRVFSDSGFTTYRRLDFDILPKKENGGRTDDGIIFPTLSNPL